MPGAHISPRACVLPFRLTWRHLWRRCPCEDYVPPATPGSPTRQVTNPDCSAGRAVPSSGTRRLTPIRPDRIIWPKMDRSIARASAEHCISKPKSDRRHGLIQKLLPVSLFQQKRADRRPNAGNSIEPGRSVTSKVVAILLTFHDGNEHSLTEIARLTCLPVSTTHRLVTELAGWGVLERADESRFRVGLPIKAIGSRRLYSPAIIESARRVLEDLVTAARTSARLGILTDTRAPDMAARLRGVTGLLAWFFPCFPACRCTSSRHRFEKIGAVLQDLNRRWDDGGDAGPGAAAVAAR